MKKFIWYIFVLSSMQSLYPTSWTHDFLQTTHTVLNKILFKSQTFVRHHKLPATLIAGALILASIPKARNFLKNCLEKFTTKIWGDRTNRIYHGHQPSPTTPIFQRGFFTGKYVEIIGAPPKPDVEWAPYHKLVGKVARIQGTTQEVWGITDIINDPDRSHYQITDYISAGSPEAGLIYYGKVDTTGYCFHESWLRELTPEELYTRLGVPLPNTRVIDSSTGQEGIVGNVHEGTTLPVLLALVPLLGKKVPCTLKLHDYVARHIDTETAQQACRIYCAKNQGLNEIYNKLRHGELIRTFIHGKTGVGKNFLACALPQESGYPYIIQEISTVRFLSTWHNSEYAGLQEILRQAVERSRTSGEKIVLILDDIDLLERIDKSWCRGVPYRPGTDALHEFFDRQESGDRAARNISIIALTDRPDYIPRHILERFSQQIILDNPDKDMRHSIIMSLIAKSNFELDESVVQHAQTLATITAGLTPRSIKQIFEYAYGLSWSQSQSNHRITWPMVQAAHQAIVSMRS